LHGRHALNGRNNLAVPLNDIRDDSTNRRFRILFANDILCLFVGSQP
jgi:hypothetical protein